MQYNYINSASGFVDNKKRRVCFIAFASWQHQSDVRQCCLVEFATWRYWWRVYHFRHNAELSTQINDVYKHLENVLEISNHSKLLVEVSAVLAGWNGGTTAQLACRQHGCQSQWSESSVHRSAAPEAVLCPTAAQHRSQTHVRRTDDVPAVPGGAPHVQTPAAGRDDCCWTTSYHAAWSLPSRSEATSEIRHKTTTGTWRLSVAAAWTVTTLSATGLVAIKNCLRHIGTKLWYLSRTGTAIQETSRTVTGVVQQQLPCPAAGV